MKKTIDIEAKYSKMGRIFYKVGRIMAPASIGALIITLIAYSFFSIEYAFEDGFAWIFIGLSVIGVALYFCGLHYLWGAKLLENTKK